MAALIEWLSTLDYPAVLTLVQTLLTAAIGAVVLYVVVFWAYAWYTERRLRERRRLPW